MATILNNKQSTAGGPYVFYTVAVDEVADSRTADEVKLKVTATSHLQYASSSLGTGSGYSLTGYLKISNVEYPITLKKSTESWSGTANHTVNKTLTISNLLPSTTSLTNIKFRVARGTGSSSSAGYLASTSCSNISISLGHDIPSDVAFTMSEANLVLTAQNVPDNVFVANLSGKLFDATCVYHDDADFQGIIVKNDDITYSSSSKPFLVNFTGAIKTDQEQPTKVPIAVGIVDDAGGLGWSETILYDLIPYTLVSITNSTTGVKRNGQTSGEALLTINGIYYNGQVGDAHQESANYKPTIKYKFWEVNDPEPGSYNYTILDSDPSYTTSGGTFSITDYEIGSQNPLDANYFDPGHSYRVKVQVQDTFSTSVSNEISIPKGIPIWTEYADRVDFEKLSINNRRILYKNILTGKPVNDVTLNTTTATKITMVESSKVGDMLSISSDGGIKIGAGISKVLVSGTVVFSTGGTSSTRKGIQIYMYDASVPETIQITYNSVAGSTTYVGASCTPFILEVEENDIIYMYGINQGATGSILTKGSSYLTVEVIE